MSYVVQKCQFKSGLCLNFSAVYSDLVCQFCGGIQEVYVQNQILSCLSGRRKAWQIKFFFFLNFC